MSGCARQRARRYWDSEEVSIGMCCFSCLVMRSGILLLVVWFSGQQRASRTVFLILLKDYYHCYKLSRQQSLQFQGDEFESY